MDYTTPPCFYRIGAKALIHNDEGKFLLIQNPNGKWELPGGGIESHETVEENLRREIREELGTEVDWVDENPSYFSKALHSEHAYPIANIIYEVGISSEIIIGISDETHGYGYFSKEEALKLESYENVKHFLYSYNPENHGNR